MTTHACSILSALLLLAAAEAAETRVMTLGDSLTAMFRYQHVLRQRLAAAGVQCTFVGSQPYGNDRHEGHPGWNTAGISGKVTGWITAAQPDVVLLQVGTNDMYHGYGTKGQYARAFPHSSDDVALAALSAQPVGGSWLDGLGKATGQPDYGSQLRAQATGLIDRILDHPRRPRLVIARIPPVGAGHPAHVGANDTCVERILEFNAHLAAVGEARRAAGRPVAVIDNFAGVKRAHGAVPGASDFGDATAQSRDWVHPASGAGAWQLMGDRFAIGTLAVLGQAVAPAPAPTQAPQPSSAAPATAQPASAQPAPAQPVPAQIPTGGGAAGPATSGGGSKGCGAGSVTGIGLLAALLQFGFILPRVARQRTRR